MTAAAPAATHPSLIAGAAAPTSPSAASAAAAAPRYPARRRPRRRPRHPTQPDGFRDGQPPPPPSCRPRQPRPGHPCDVAQEAAAAVPAATQPRIQPRGRRCGCGTPPMSPRTRPRRRWPRHPPRLIGGKNNTKAAAAAPPPHANNAAAARAAAARSPSFWLQRRPPRRPPTLSTAGPAAVATPHALFRSDGGSGTATRLKKGGGTAPEPQRLCRHGSGRGAPPQRHARRGRVTSHAKPPRPRPRGTWRGRQTPPNAKHAAGSVSAAAAVPRATMSALRPAPVFKDKKAFLLEEPEKSHCHNNVPVHARHTRA